MNEAIAISGTRRQYKEMADGTLRVQIDIDPQFKQRFLEMFGQIDMPVALAPLEADFEKPKEKPKGGELSKLAAMWCQDERFWKWAMNLYGWDTIRSESDARAFILEQCHIESRAELDHNEEAEEHFHKFIRIPFSRYLYETGGFMSSVGDEFPNEQARCRELLQAYREIGPAGAFGAMMIEQALQRAEQAMASGDPVKIIQSFQELKGCE